MESRARRENAAAERRKPVAATVGEGAPRPARARLVWEFRKMVAWQADACRAFRGDCARSGRPAIGDPIIFARSGCGDDAVSAVLRLLDTERSSDPGTGDGDP